MTRHILMVDVDGVVVRPADGRRWDADLEKDLGLAAAVLDRVFFREHFADVVVGRADLAERLAAVLPEVTPVSPHELMAYWFARDAALDERLLADITAVRTTGVEAHLATVQEHHRARYLWETLGLRRWFGAIHYAADVGFVKTEPGFYDVVRRRTGLAPERHCLIDDAAANVEAARAAGWCAFRWLPTSTLAEVLRGLDDGSLRSGGGAPATAGPPAH